MKEKRMRWCKKTIPWVLLSILSVTSYGADWPRWRGPDSDGISKETRWNPRALNGGAAILWEIQVGKGHSTVVTRGDYLFTQGNRPSITSTDTTFEEVVYCLNKETGRIIWQYGYPALEGRDYRGPGATPLIDHDRLYTLGREAQLYCFDLENGDVLWTRDLLKDSLTALHPWGTSASPMVDGDVLLINGGLAGLGFNKMTGALKWKSEFGVCGYATPVLMDYQGNRSALIQGEKNLHLVNVENGAILWSFAWEAVNDPILLEDGLFLSAGRGGPKQGIMRLKWDGENEEEIWNLSRQDVAFQNWVVMNGYAYGVFRNREHRFQCIDLADGTLKWNEDLGEWGSLTAVNDKLVIITGEGDLIIANADPKGLDILSRARVIRKDERAQHRRPLSHFIWTNPVFSGGKVYVRSTFGNLVCVDLSE